MSDEKKPPRIPVHVVPPPPPDAATDDRIRNLRPSRPPTEVEKLLQSMAEHLRVIGAHVKLSRGEIARVRAEAHDFQAAMIMLLEDYMKRHGDQLDAHTEALQYLVDRARGNHGEVRGR